ncbi:MAG: hypothetical protein GEU90_18005 [Gemmatimonas sp.]|nr:hypothetical protein [Gemmatimonas sp.]
MRSNRAQQLPTRRVVRRGAVMLAISAIASCDSILEVDLPGQVTEEALFEAGQAPILVNSVVSLFECGYSDFVASDAAGYEDILTRDTGWWGGRHEFDPEPATTECNTADTSVGWWTPLQSARFLGEDTYRMITEEWADQDVAADRDHLLAELAIYNGAVYNLFGEHFCEVAFEGGALMSPEQVLASAEEWLTRALSHINNAGGDFAIPDGSSSSANQMAHLIRARVRFALGDHAGATADASEVSRGFMAYVTRDAGGERTQWNKVYNSHNQEQINTVIGAIDWWTGPPNPANGGAWGPIIPFTGYRNLGILPDGRAVDQSGVAITTTANEAAVLDPRTPVLDEGRVFNEHPVWRQQKYPGLDADIPLANWQEAWLILAKIEGGQEAIDRVNDIRAFHDLPEVSYVDPGNAQEVYNMVIEEERRSLFLEGRFWSTKIQENLWFPRNNGRVQPPTTFGYLGGVRMVMPESEYELNPNFDLSTRATMCSELERPIV